MSTVQATAFCHTCQRQSLFEKPRINHVLHLILSIVTIGAWSIVWITLGVLNVVRGLRCATCGVKRGTPAPHSDRDLTVHATTPADDRREVRP